MIKKIITFICMMMVFSGMCLLTYNIIKDKEIKREDNKKIEEFFNNYSEEIENINTDENVETVIVNNDIDLSSYLAVIEIPSISLKTGVVMSDTSYKSMDRNVSVFPTSDMPNVKDGNFILFGHNGNSRVSYFKNIYKLNKGDDIYIYYNNQKFNYKVISKYDISMNSDIPLSKIDGKTIITLITCKKNNNKYRTIVVGGLVNDK